MACCARRSLQISSTVEFQRIWWDKHSQHPSMTQVSLWRPVPPPGYVSLGDCMVTGMYCPPNNVLVLRDTDPSELMDGRPPLLARPMGCEMVRQHRLLATAVVALCKVTCHLLYLLSAVLWDWQRPHWLCRATVKPNLLCGPYAREPAAPLVHLRCQAGNRTSIANIFMVRVLTAAWRPSYTDSRGIPCCRCCFRCGVMATRRRGVTPTTSLCGGLSHPLAMWPWGCWPVLAARSRQA
jgi:hypothetical protein